MKLKTDRVATQKKVYDCNEKNRILVPIILHDRIHHAESGTGIVERHRETYKDEGIAKIKVLLSNL